MRRKFFAFMLAITTLVMALLSLLRPVAPPHPGRGRLRLGRGRFPLGQQISPSAIVTASIQRINGQISSPSPTRSTTSSWVLSAWESRHQPI
jgi:hypothetical protein